MTGYILTLEAATAVNTAIADAQTVRGFPVFWLPGKMLIHSGAHAGLWFVPADDLVLSTPLMGSPVQHPHDFPEFAALIESLGGLDARADIDPTDLICLIDRDC